MSRLTIDDLLDQLEQARQMAIEERKPSAMIQATATMAKLTGLDKPVIKDVEPIANRPTVIRLVAGVSANDASKAYRDIMG
ncbi:hypothetical protein [Psychrobacter sp. CMS30]|uniref:hypothetical protein n=1 Tax=Psychrobacter sp. CMS30 TaxID=2774126 RepID=UPI00191B149F|nr:hypothetical protein [Psychrobacter sp. CMS30]